MEQNINQHEEQDDAEGHRFVLQDGAPGVTGALNDPTAPKAGDPSDDTEGHRYVLQDGAPGAASDDDDTEGHKQYFSVAAPDAASDDDDTEGHRFVLQYEAPGVTGALNDPTAPTAGDASDDRVAL